MFLLHNKHHSVLLLCSTNVYGRKRTNYIFLNSLKMLVRIFFSFMHSQSGELYSIVLVILDVLYYCMYLGSSDCTVSLMDCTTGSMTQSTHTLSFTAPLTYTHHHSTETTPERSVTDPSKEAVRRNLGSMFRYAIKLLLFHSLMICTLWGIKCPPLGKFH